MAHRVPQVAIWILSRLVPKREREPLVGDLTEEYGLRASATSSSAARNWCVRQVLASAPHLLWIAISRSVWVSTGGVALLAYIAVGAIELVVNWAIAISPAGSAAEYNPLGMLITFPMVVLVGYFAARLRRRAPIVLAAMMLAAVTLMTLTSTEHLPIGYRMAYFAVGPLAAILGSVLRSRRRY